ncbi:hypothetical protein NGA_0252402 [Nannochloropsis gaditana CCMP526]|uniref:uncharacterized protein n=1 Tax=Nannochloropsis gaditana (strain CCMP526) TaxID=1093141 RepID=UPI00029F6502|nr:hypothetical protein NGA_0252402 [Nannochloropsis gaditana CCMP526]EKU22748.1 hypothetical protein NGA_0252402 [Nannochloropsis gaditana CCMP526]|eukprot:XP_005853609.1 hypothetical protein NGA_0252402 [Nannochloropsis gaditana CCMP526]
MMFLRLSILALLAASVFAFVPPAPRVIRSASQVVFAEAEKNFITEADNCLNGECSIDDVNDLLIQLRVEIKSLKTKLAEVEACEQQLTQMNGAPLAKDAVRDIIKAVLRAMDVDPEDSSFPQIVRAAGFAGEKFKKKGSFDGVPYKKA